LKTINNKYNLFLLLATGINLLSSGQSKSGIENYHYMGKQMNYIWAPVIHNVTDKGIYSEMRYNYEALNTASLYVGKIFSTKGVVESSFTPTAGIVGGRYTGASVALNTQLNYRNIFFNSQAQYTVSADRTADNFYFNWSDLYYKMLPWLMTGISMQQTGLINNALKTQTGVMMGVTKGRWSIPLYLFNVLNDQKYFIVGINVEWERIKKNDVKSNIP
jgi:hypothetical protein